MARNAMEMRRRRKEKEDQGENDDGDVIDGASGCDRSKPSMNPRRPDFVLTKLLSLAVALLRVVTTRQGGTRHSGDTARWMS